MSRLIQLDLFVEQEDPWVREVYELKELCKETKLSSDKVRKALFARNGELAKMVLDLHQRLEIMERNICKPDLALKEKK